MMLILAIVAAALAGCVAPEDNAPPLHPVALGVGYVPNVQFAPLYVGIKQGFFAAERIELSLAHGFENDYLALVGTGEAQFMIGSGDQVVIGRSQGLPVRSVAEWYTQYPVVAFALEGTGLSSAADLAGRKVGLPGPYGANYVALRALLDSAGLSEADIQMESIGFVQAAAISEGLVEVAIDYAVNGPVVLAQAGIATEQVGLEGTVPIPANGLVTNEETIAQNPELVRGMVDALLRSVAWTLENPDAAFDIALEFVPEAGGANEAANRAVFDASLPFWTPQPGATPGAADPAAWAAASTFLFDIGLAANAPAADALFTNAFIPE